MNFALHRLAKSILHSIASQNNRETEKARQNNRGTKRAWQTQIILQRPKLIMTLFLGMRPSKIIPQIGPSQNKFGTKIGYCKITFQLSIISYQLSITLF